VNAMVSKQFLISISITCLLSGSLFAEVFSNGKGFDRYGGYVAYQGTATGRFAGICTLHER